MDLLRRRFEPFVFHVHRLRNEDAARTLADEPGMRRLYGLWRQLDGTTTLARGDEQIDLRPGEVGLSEPGMSAVLHRRARVNCCAFSLLPRRRLYYDMTVTMDIDEPAEPPWSELFNRALPLRLPEPHRAAAADLADRISLSYWRDAAHRQAAGLRLGTWLLDLMANGRAPDHLDSLVQDLDDLIAARAREPVTVADLARQLGVSVSLCARRYHARRGIGPGTALRRARIAQARDLLVRDETSVAAIAARVGYRDPNAFIRAFHREVGESPGRWRRRQRPGPR